MSQKVFKKPESPRKSQKSLTKAVAAPSPPPTTASTKSNKAIIPGTKAFAVLQRAWYRKLKASGFNDLEVIKGNNVDFAPNLQGQSLRGIANSYNKEQETYYRLLSNFLASNPHYKQHSPAEKFICRAHTDGMPFRQISAQARKQKLRVSVFKAFVVAKAFAKEALQWNRTHRDGHLFQSDIG